MKGAITQEQMEDALQFLSDTDDQCAALRADMARFEFRAKRKKSAVFQISAGSVAERNALADTHTDTEAAYEQYFEAMRKYHAMTNQRDTKTIVVDTWRSLNANRRQGQ